MGTFAVILVGQNGPVNEIANSEVSCSDFCRIRIVFLPNLRNCPVFSLSTAGHSSFEIWPPDTVELLYLKLLLLEFPISWSTWGKDFASLTWSFYKLKFSFLDNVLPPTVCWNPWCFLIWKIISNNLSITAITFFSEISKPFRGTWSTFSFSSMPQRPETTLGQIFIECREYTQLLTPFDLNDSAFYLRIGWFERSQNI